MMELAGYGPPEQGDAERRIVEAVRGMDPQQRERFADLMDRYTPAGHTAAHLQLLGKLLQLQQLQLPQRRPGLL